MQSRAKRSPSELVLVGAIMNHLDDSVKPCSTMGHVYASVLVIRCPHHEGYTVHATAWVDDPSGEPQVLSEALEEFGPFDDEALVQKRVAFLGWKAVGAVQSLNL